jgi:hypothetical protein
MYWKRQFPYAENNKWGQDLDEKRRWTEALERRDLLLASSRSQMTQSSPTSQF